MKIDFETYQVEKHKQLYGTSIKHPCIDKLANLLDQAEVPYTRDYLWDGERIGIGDLCDAICHKYSKGHEKDLLEIQGALTEEEFTHDLVKGNMTPEEVAKRFIYCYQNNTSTYKEN